VAGRLATVPGVIGVILGGSRARRDHLPSPTPTWASTTGCRWTPTAWTRWPSRSSGRPVTSPSRAAGVRGWTAAAGCGSAASRWTGSTATSTGWRPSGRPPSRAGTRSTISRATPLGFADLAYPGELALGKVLSDPTGELAALQGRVRSSHRPWPRRWSPGCGRPTSWWRSPQGRAAGRLRLYRRLPFPPGRRLRLRSARRRPAVADQREGRGGRGGGAAGRAGAFPAAGRRGLRRRGRRSGAPGRRDRRGG